ncbi:DNA internalization-related competence protein ComEC/Rec2 [Parvibium lacunae]|uniref:DNA internalization-related competence protein ComEC/Rec2 n=1 Tax=Parvibium lacunae TaxID=1888893 RepID=A0A368L7Q6_9BURK|nr:DNA internalization-related competence protein ComEC/Rec2 [Parvibium lacunae]RCS59647.1 DNA internalization-related competence protein ComEC/Rec2 [Parvibium lacunae]
MSAADSSRSNWLAFRPSEKRGEAAHSGTVSLPLVLLAWCMGIAYIQTQTSLWPLRSAVILAVLLANGLCALGLAKSYAKPPPKLYQWGAGLAQALLAFALGLIWACWWADTRLQARLPAVLENEPLTLVGVIDSLPHPLDRGQRVTLRVEALSPITALNGDKAYPISPPLGVETEHDQFSWPDFRLPARVSLSWADGLADQVRPAQRWQFQVKLHAPYGNQNPGGFDYERWLLEENVGAIGQVIRPRDPAEAATIALKRQELVWNPLDRLQRVRGILRHKILQAFVTRDGLAPYRGVITALVMGDQRAIDPADWRLFNQTGVGHLIAISGLHITMLATFAAWLTGGVWRQRLRQGNRQAGSAPQAGLVVGVLVAAAYCSLAGWGIPAQRTFLMLLVVAWGTWRYAGSQPLFSLCLAAALVLAWDPMACLAPGFWLSYVAVAILLWLGQRRRLALVTPAPPNGVPDKYQAWRRFGGSLQEASRLQLAISVGLVPLTVLFFQQVSWIGPIANAIAIPVISFGVTPLSLLGAIWVCLPGIGSDLGLQAAHGLLAALIAGLEVLSALPYASTSLPLPAWPVLLLAGLGCVWLCLPLRWPWRLLGIGWCLPLLLAPADWPSWGEWRITALDVGQGNAVLIQTQQHTLLYDTGPAYGNHQDASTRVILPYLRHQGLLPLSALVVSHRDQDHAGGLISLWQATPPEQFYTSMSAAELPAFITQSGRYQPCRAGMQWTWDGVHFAFLHPQEPADWSSSNEKSCVLAIWTARGRQEQGLLLTGDISQRVEQALLTRAATDPFMAARLKQPVLLVPHHGSATSSSAAWLAHVQPRYAILQAGQHNAYGHPHAQVLERYRAQGVQLLETRQGGAWRLDFNTADVLQPSAWRQENCRYWHHHC